MAQGGGDHSDLRARQRFVQAVPYPFTAWAEFTHPLDKRRNSSSWAEKIFTVQPLQNGQLTRRLKSVFLAI
jgi:hypothetical protein